MQIQLFSDLHIEFEELNISCENADVVVFAGDIELGTRCKTAVSRGRCWSLIYKEVEMTTNSHANYK